MIRPCSLSNLIRQVALGVMKVNGVDINVGVKGVAVENRASSVMGLVEPITKNVMVDTLRCLL